MIDVVTAWLLARGIGAGRARGLAWSILIGVPLLLAAAGAAIVLWRIYDAGAAKIRADVAEQHVQRVTEARADERTAGAVAAAIGTRAAGDAAAADARLQSTIRDIHDAIEALPPAGAAGLPAAAPVERLRASVNGGIDRANRAADAADAAR